MLLTPLQTGRGPGWQAFAHLAAVPLQAERRPERCLPVPARAAIYAPASHANTRAWEGGQPNWHGRSLSDNWYGEPYSTVLYYTILCCTILYSNALYYTMSLHVLHGPCEVHVSIAFSNRARSPLAREASVTSCYAPPGQQAEKRHCGQVATHRRDNQLKSFTVDTRNTPAGNTVVCDTMLHSTMSLDANVSIAFSSRPRVRHSPGEHR